MSQPLYRSAADAGVWGERGYGNGSTPYTWLSSVTLLPRLPSFPPQVFPTTVFLACPQSVSLQSSAALALGLCCNPYTPAPSCCTFHATCVPLPGGYGCGKDCLILIPFRLPQISCFTLSLKCVSSDSDSCPFVGIRPLLQFPHLLFFPLVPSSYRVLRGCICYFLLVRSFCLLSAGVLHALLRLKVCSWCIHGERGTPHPPATSPSCSLPKI